MYRLAAASLLSIALSFQTAASPIETSLKAPGPKGPLRGTMLAPKGSKGPVVLIVPGSGPTDRDGNNPLGIRGGPYKLLAEGLAVRGIATVRIDKRGMYGSAQAVADPNAVTIDDYAVDIHNWIAVIRGETGVPCVWVAGHSEGGLVALAASRNADDLCGLVLIAAPGRRLGDVLRDQAKLNFANTPLLPQTMAAIATLEDGKKLDASAMSPALMQLFAPQVQGFLISMFALDPAKLAAEFKKPILILQGNCDLQVSIKDAERLKQSAGAGARLVVLPDTNHVLKIVTSADPGANRAAYANAGLPLAPGVVDNIADFVQAPQRSD